MGVGLSLGLSLSPSPSPTQLAARAALLFAHLQRAAAPLPRCDDFRALRAALRAALHDAQRGAQRAEVVAARQRRGGALQVREEERRARRQLGWAWAWA